MKILTVEDEVELLNSICSFLKKEGFICEYAPDFRTAEDKLSIYKYDLLILDITLPDGNGLDLISKVKEFSPETGILILSAKNSLDDKLVGLDLGADDYMTKPFHLAELKSRIYAIIRRRGFKGNSIIRIGEIEIDILSRMVSVNNKPVDLTKKEFDLLIYLITNKNRVLSHESIAEHLWGDHMDLADNFDFVYTHIKNLRKKLQQSGASSYVKSVYGIGYKLSVL
jgi:DNA-binding response OmpR family regulator